MGIKSLFAGAVKITKVQDHSTAATSAVTSDAVDMAGYEGVAFLSSFGTAAAANTVKLQQSSDNGSADGFSDIEGTSVSSGTTDEDVWVEIYRPTKRYVKAVFARGTSSTLESVWAFQYGARQEPVSNVVSGTIVGEYHAAPDEGTA